MEEKIINVKEEGREGGVRETQNIERIRDIKIADLEKQLQENLNQKAIWENDMIALQ